MKGIEYPGGMQLLVEASRATTWVAPLPEALRPSRRTSRCARPMPLRWPRSTRRRWPPAARDNGAPGPRDYHPGYYAAFVYDPEGNNIEAVIHDGSE